MANKTAKVVNCSVLNKRSGAGTSFKITGSLKSGHSGVVVDSKKVGSSTWYKWKDGGWSNGKYLKITKSQTTNKNTKANKEKEAKKKTTAKLNKESKAMAKKYAAILNSGYDDAAFLNCNPHLFGAPHHFTKTVDYRGTSLKLGREYINHIMTEAPLVYIIPGKANYLPNVSKKERKALSTLFGDSEYDTTADKKSIINKIIKGDKNVRYFELKEDYATYMKYVNMLCRMCAIYMGLGDNKAPGGKVALKRYNWKNYKWRDDYTKEKNDKSTFTTETSAKKAKTKKAKKTALARAAKEMEESLYGKYSYIPFYANPMSSYSDTFTNRTRESSLKSRFESGESMVKELQFLTGQSKLVNAVSSGVTTGIEGLGSLATAAGLNNSNSAISRLVGSTSQVVQGANIAFPEIWEDSDHEASFDFTVELVSPYGTREAIYYNCIVPLCHLLAFAMPKYSGPNSYKSPFLIKAFCPGFFNTELAIIESLAIEKGGEGHWSHEGLPTRIVCTVRVRELYSSLFMNKSTEPIKFFKNTALMNYLSVMCGVDITRPQLMLKLETLVAAVIGRVEDIPENVLTSFMEGIKNWVGGFFHF